MFIQLNNVTKIYRVGVECIRALSVVAPARVDGRALRCMRCGVTVEG